jgi:hypothetical protein
MHEVAYLEGTIPPEIASLSALNVLDLKQTGLGGTIPTQIGILNKLTKLHLGSYGTAAFSGTIPTELGLLTDLRVRQNVTNAPNTFGLT